MTSKGIFARKTRHLTGRHKPSRMTIAKLLKAFKEGDKVVVLPKGTFNNIPHPRYKGHIGTVVGIRGGSSYAVRVDLTKSTYRTLIVKQEYLERHTLESKKSNARMPLRSGQ